MYIISDHSSIKSIHDFYFNCKKMKSAKYNIISFEHLQHCFQTIGLEYPISVNYKKINILLSEVAKKLYSQININEPFVFILRANIVQNNGPNVYFFPMNQELLYHFTSSLIKSRKVREVACILYSYDGYVVSSKHYKNKLILDSEFVRDGYTDTNMYLSSILSSLNIKITNTSGDYLLDIVNSHPMKYIEKVLNKS